MTELQNKNIRIGVKESEKSEKHKTDKLQKKKESARMEISNKSEKRKSGKYKTSGRRLSQTKASRLR